MENNNISGLVFMFSLVMLLVAIILNSNKENNHLILSGKKQEIFRASSFKNDLKYQYSS